MLHVCEIHCFRNAKESGGSLTSQLLVRPSSLGSIWLLFCFDHCSGPTSECQMRRTLDFLSVWFEFAGFGPSQVTGFAFSNTGDYRADCSNKKWPCTILIKTLRYCFHIEAKANTFHLTSWEIWMIFSPGMFSPYVGDKWTTKYFYC